MAGDLVAEDFAADDFTVEAFEEVLVEVRDRFAAVA